MNRRPTTQDITWLLDLNRNKQLDLDPPYQRRSVWTNKAKQFFLDTIFRNYPSPAIFLHKTLNEVGQATYHVVDGKQRTQTILDFAVNDKIRIAKDYGDVRLDGKKWSELAGETTLRQLFWNYQITVEQIDNIEGTVVNNVFDRLNRNARKLMPQELRHAKFDGWLIKWAEGEAMRLEWVRLGIVTKARYQRMSDAQFISELMLVTLEQKVMGFDQDDLDELYAKYEDPAETLPELDPDVQVQRFDGVKEILLAMESHNSAVSEHAKSLGNVYTLWSLVTLTPDLPAPAVLATRYAAFMGRVETLSAQENLQTFLVANPGNEFAEALNYLNNSRGASTDLAQRNGRLEALKLAITAAN